MDNIDYKKLLIKYIKHVGEQEGVSFISDKYRSTDFTNIEWQELKVLEECIESN